MKDDSERFREFCHNLDEQIRQEQQRMQNRAPDGDRRLGPGTPPKGMKEWRTGKDRRSGARSRKSEG